MVFAFGASDFGSEQLWMLLGQHVQSRFKDFSEADFDMVLQGYQSDLPAHKSSVMIQMLFQEQIM